MTTRHHIASAPVPTGGKPSSSLANSYLAHKADPHSQAKLNAFGTELDCLLRKFLCDGSQTGCLHREEPDIRQSAAHLLVHSYLDGNPRLQAGVRSNSTSIVENEIKRSTNAALKIISKRMIRRSVREQNTLNEFTEMALYPEAGQKYLSVRRKFAALIQTAQQQGKISIRNAKILQALIIDERSRDEVAERFGLTLDAIAQIVHRAKPILCKMEPSVDM